jgi:hypothetical protein
MAPLAHALAIASMLLPRPEISIASGRPPLLMPR